MINSYVQMQENLHELPCSLKYFLQVVSLQQGICCSWQKKMYLQLPVTLECRFAAWPSQCQPPSPRWCSPLDKAWGVLFQRLSAIKHKQIKHHDLLGTPVNRHTRGSKRNQPGRTARSCRTPDRRTHSCRAKCHPRNPVEEDDRLQTEQSRYY